jgi:hypothetical protein
MNFRERVSFIVKQTIADMGLNTEANDTDGDVNIGGLRQLLSGDMSNNPQYWPNVNTLTLQRQLNAIEEEKKKEKRRRFAERSCL